MVPPERSFMPSLKRPLLAACLLASGAAFAQPTPLANVPAPPPMAAPALLPVPHPAPPVPDARRWTDVTPDAMIDDAAARALAAPTDADVVASAVTILALEDRAAYGHAQKALES